MYLYNKEHAIYCMNCKNDTIGPGSNLLLEFTEQMDSRLSTTLKLIGQSLAESQAVFLEYLEVDSIVIVKKKPWFFGSKQLLRTTQLSSQFFSQLHWLMVFCNSWQRAVRNSSKLCFGKRT